MAATSAGRSLSLAPVTWSQLSAGLEGISEGVKGLVAAEFCDLADRIVNICKQFLRTVDSRDCDFLENGVPCGGLEPHFGKSSRSRHPCCDFGRSQTAWCLVMYALEDRFHALVQPEDFPRGTSAEKLDRTEMPIFMWFVWICNGFEKQLCCKLAGFAKIKLNA